MQYNSTNNNAPNSNAPSNASSNAPLDDTQLNKSTDENTEVTLIRTGYNRELFRSTFSIFAPAHTGSTSIVSLIHPQYTIHRSIHHPRHQFHLDSQIWLLMGKLFSTTIVPRQCTATHESIYLPRQLQSFRCHQACHTTPCTGRC